MKQKCECNECKAGGTSHNDSSHDQSLDQRFEFLEGDSIRIVGGTTKCARVAMRYFAKLGPGGLRGRKVMEFGSGTGLVGIRSVVAVLPSRAHSWRLVVVLQLGAPWRLRADDRPGPGDGAAPRQHPSQQIVPRQGRQGRQGSDVDSHTRAVLVLLLASPSGIAIDDLRVGRGDEKMMSDIKTQHGLPEILIGESVGL